MFTNFSKIPIYPKELLNISNWIPVSKDKRPTQYQWYDNLYYFNSPILSRKSIYRGFVISKEPYYLVLDFDHVLEDGKFINSDAEQLYQYIQEKLNTYCEVSVSTHGLHLIAKPPTDYTFSGTFRITFSENCFLEVFYKPKNRYILLTGFSNGKEIATGEPVNEIWDMLWSKKDTGKSISPIQEKQEKPILEENPGRILDILYHISPDCNRKTWIECLWTCKQIGLSKEEFRKWSKNSYKYNEEDFEKQWRDSKNSNWTIGTLIYYAKQNNWIDLFSFPYTKIGTAQLIYHLYGDILKYVIDTKEWALYKDGYWELSDSIFPILSKFYINLVNYLTSIKPKDKKANRFIETLSNNNYFEDTMRIYKGLNTCNSNDFNTYNHLLNVNNGVINLKTGELLPKDSIYMFTYKLSTNYNPNAESSLVNNFFTSILPNEDTRKAFLRFLGYCLTGEIKEQKALFIFGKGGNGKSVCLQLLKSLMEEIFTILDESSLKKVINFNIKNRVTPDLINLKYKRLSVIDELSNSYTLDTNLFKKLTGGTQLNVRGLFEKKECLLQLNTKLIISGNNTPEFLEANANAMKRRILFIYFSQNFIKNPDRNLLTKLTNNLSAFLNLLVREAVMYYKEGLLEAPDMSTYKTLYLNNLNDIENFIREVCKFGTKNKVKRKKLIDLVRKELNLVNIKDIEITNSILNIEGVSLGMEQHIMIFNGISCDLI